MRRLFRWQDLRLRTKGLFVVAIPSAAMVALAIMVYWLGAQTADEEECVRRSLRVSEAIQRARASEAELGGRVRAYFIVSDPIFAKTTRNSIATFDVALQRLLQLAGGNPAQVRRLSRIAAIERSRVERIYADMALLATGRLPSDQLRAGVRAAETEHSLMDALLGAMEKEEQRSLEFRLGRVNRLRTVRRISSLICVFLGGLGGVILSLLFASGITKRIRALQENLDRLAYGGVLDTLSMGRDEIGGLGQGIAKAAEILRRRSTVLEHALHGIAEVDACGRCSSYNKAYAELADLPECCIPVSITETVHSDDRAKVEAAIAAMRANGHAEVDARIVRRQGRSTYVSMSVFPISEGLDSGYYIFLYDSTLRRETEMALIIAKDAALASNLARTQFLAKISHDIRTPLNAILGAADLLSLTPLSSDQSEYVSLFQRNCRRLVRLINDFLDFSRIEAGAVQVQKAPCRIRDTVDDAIATFRESASRKGIQLGSEIDPLIPEWAVIDAARVQQVLDNLISNAVKFTPAGRVSVHVQKIGLPYGDAIRFPVHDTGPGINQEDLGTIFSAFTQLPDRDSSERGSGLGLTICRELVELMGGEIGVSSPNRCGSIFYFTLPLHTLTEQDEAPAAPPSAICQGWCLDDPARILVAEDTADNRLLLEHYLREEPVEITFAFDGEQAVELSQRCEFDLVLMDIDLPGIDGYEATKLIRKWQAENGRVPTPIIALSAHAMKEAVRASLHAGCVAHLAKPVDRSVLLKTIHRFALSKSVRAQCPPEVCVVADGVASLVPVYLASKPRQIEEAKAALAINDYEPVRRFGHNLKGTGRGYGFPFIEQIGAEIEQSATVFDEESIRRQLESLSRFVAENDRTPEPASSRSDDGIDQ